LDVCSEFMKHDPINLIAVGDICPGDHFSMGFGTGTLMRKRGPSFALSRVCHLLSRGDVVFGNCEGVISAIDQDPSSIDTMEFRGVPEFASALRRAGFTTLSVANNHAGEHGAAVLSDTVRNLQSAGIDVVGLRGKDRTAEPLIREVKGIRIGWLAYTWIVSRNDAHDRAALSWTRGDEIAEEVAALRRRVDFIIVSAHWGREFVRVPQQSIIERARRIADSGANLILGHHPHVLQGAERYRNCMILYSLGNFLFDMPQRRYRESAVFRCSIERGEVRDPGFVPVRINRRFQPQLPHPSCADRILRELEEGHRAIWDPAALERREDRRAKEMETLMKRRLLRGQVLYLALSLGRMGPRVALQKLRRRVTGLPLKTGAARSVERRAVDHGLGLRQE
jgi:poly-gamma-glutamate synthesis protein (capsule biosynthesis protein)